MAIISMDRRTILCGAAALAAAPVAQAQALKPIKIGLLSLPTNAPVFIAQAKGWFAEEGLNPEFVYFTAAAPLFPAVTAGSIDVGATGVTAATFNLGSKGGFKIIGGGAREMPHYRVNAFLATQQAYEAGFTSLTSLRGKRLGITGAGSTQHYNIALIARRMGLTNRDYSLISLQSLDNMYAAFQGGQIDGGLFPAGPSVRFVASGAGRILGWGGDLTPWQIVVLFANPTQLASDRDKIARYVRVWKRAARYYHDAILIDASGKRGSGANYAEVLDIVAAAVKQPVASLDGYLPYIEPEAKLDVSSLNDQLAFWKVEKVVAGDVELPSMLDASFVNAS